MQECIGEASIIDKIFLDAGHLVIASRRYHPDLAGAGIESAWGKAKLDYDCEVKNLTRNILPALGDQTYEIKTVSGEVEHDAPLPLNRVRRFARRVRTNRRLLECMPTKADAGKVEGWGFDGAAADAASTKKDRRCGRNDRSNVSRGEGAPKYD